MSDCEDNQGFIPVRARSSYHQSRVFNSNSRGRSSSGVGGHSNEPLIARGNSRGARETRRNFRQDGNKKVITIPSDKVGRVIGRGGSKIRELEYESKAKIKIGDSSGNTTCITLLGTNEAITKVDSMINSITEERKPVNEFYTNPPLTGQCPPSNECTSNPTPEPRQPPSKRFYKIDENGEEVIDWDKIEARSKAIQERLWVDLPPVVKDFYNEDPVISKMSPSEVARWRSVNNDIQVKRTFEDKAGLKPIPNPVLTFEQAFQTYPEILQEIKKQGFERPSPIQSQSWPILLSGEDMIGIAQTGTGKTLAFLLPALIHIDRQPLPRDKRPGPTVLIMAPTRELALQIEKEVGKYEYKGIKSVCIYGGGNRKEQVKASKGVDIVIATPGRLNDLVMTQCLAAEHFSYIVLDEADRMLDMGFESQIRRALFDVRPNKQTVMTSATWPPGVRGLAETYMKDPIQVNVGSLDLAAVHSVTQMIMFVEEDDKDAHLFKFIQNMAANDKVIIFCGKKATATHISTELSIKGVECQSLHGDRYQSDRIEALENMVNGTVNILVATDVMSRGIDIKNLTHVINLDFPRHIEDYVHRVGRTGRAGNTGVSLTFLTRKDWAHAQPLIKILEEANQEVPDELYSMAERFEAMKKRKERSGQWNSDQRGRGGRGRRGYY